MHTLTLHPKTLHPPDISPDFVWPNLPPADPPDHITVAGNDLTIFVESPPLFDAMAADILAATRRVWLEVYIFYNDAGGTRIADALKRKAREGLDVRLMFDALGSSATPLAFFTDMANAGVKIHEFHSFLEGLRRFRPLTILNRRDHRKILVVDDDIGYFGGMNIIDNVETVEQQKAENRPASSGWRDVHVRLRGPDQPPLAESYERFWKRVRKEPIPRRSKAYRRAAYNIHGNEETIRFFDSGPRDKYSRAARVFTHLLRHAHHTITISMAYFIPVGKPMRALLAARRKGVRIRVIVPGKSDVRLVQRATSFLYDKLIRRGFRIYERRHRMLHSKVIVVDNAYTLIGSCNLDPRSMYINHEFMAVIRSQKLAEIISRICRFEISQSERITLRRCQQVSWYQRLLNRVAWTLRWWL